MNPAKTFRLALCSAIAASLAPAIALAQPEAGAVQSKDTVRFDIPSQPMAQALRAYAAQAGMQLLYRTDVVSALTAPALTGEFDRPTALRRLLAGTDLEVVYSSELVATVRRRDTAPASAGGAEVIDGVTPAAAPVDHQEAPVGKDNPAAMESIVVTGSRIRGGSSPSPVVTIGAEIIREEGFNDLGEVIRSVPQNFRGGQNPGVAGGATAGAGGLANQNLTGGSGLNLRGLGPDATLTLLNGRRMAYGGFVQAVDISAIPVEAVERIEIVADGASAIYGSDAVGGVGNVILLRDYEGISAGARYGAATEGGMATREYNLTGGTTWSTGGIIATYKNVDADGLFARQRDYTAYMFDPSTLYPESRSESGLLSLHQSIGSSAELKLDALRTERHQTTFPYNGGGAPYYSMMDVKTSTTLISPGLDISLPNGWLMQVGTSWGEDRVAYRQFDVDIASGARSTFNDQCFCNKNQTYDIGVEGPLFALPGGEARIAAGVGYRKNEFSNPDHLTNSMAIEGDESSRFAYTEISMPFIAPEMDVRGVRRLELNVAARSEDYDSFGGVTTPKIGLIYSPNADFTVKGSWGKSFKAPTLFQRYRSRSATLLPASYFGGGYPPEATVLSLYGGNPNLGPERARTWSASIDFHPEAMPEFQSELTWFDIDYTERVVEPMPNFASSLGNPAYDQFIRYNPSRQEQEQLIAMADFFGNYTGAPYDPNLVAAMTYGAYVNVARQRIKGLDVSASYRFDVGSGQLTIRGATSWLDSAQQATRRAHWYDIAGTLFSPARINGRLGAVWVKDGFSASSFVNYTSGVINRLVEGKAEKTSSFTTLDATLRYEADGEGSPLSGWAFALSAQNLLDREPPFYVPTGAANTPYDSTNYSAMGRFLSLSVFRKF